MPAKAREGRDMMNSCTGESGKGIRIPRHFPAEGNPDHGVRQSPLIAEPRPLRCAAARWLYAVKDEKNMKVQRAVAAVLLGLAASAHAAPADDMAAYARNNLYVGVNGSLFDDPTVLGIGAQIGAKVHPN